MVFTAVCHTRPLASLRSALCVVMDMLYTNQPADTLQSWGRDDAQKKSPHFRSEEKTSLLWILKGFWICANITTVTFSRKWLRERKSEAVFTQSNVHHRWKTSCWTQRTKMAQAAAGILLFHILR